VCWPVLQFFAPFLGRGATRREGWPTTGVDCFWSTTVVWPTRRTRNLHTQKVSCFLHHMLKRTDHFFRRHIFFILLCVCVRNSSECWVIYVLLPSGVHFYCAPFKTWSQRRKIVWWNNFLLNYDGVANAGASRFYFYWVVAQRRLVWMRCLIEKRELNGRAKRLCLTTAGLSNKVTVASLLHSKLGFVNMQCIQIYNSHWLCLKYFNKCRPL